MNIVEKLSLQIDKKNRDYEALLSNNVMLKAQLDLIKNKNDHLERKHEDMLLSIDKTLNITTEDDAEQELDISEIRKSIEQ